MNKDTKDAIKKQILNKIERAKTYKSKIEPKDKERLQRFRADKDYYEKKLPNLTEYSFTDTSIMSAVERMTAQLMKMIFGNNDIGSIKGRNKDDDANSETMQELCNWQVEYANVGYQKFYWWVKECLYQLYSVVMVTQKREYEEVEEDQQVPFNAADAWMEQAEANKIDILEVSEGVMQDPNTGKEIPCYNVKIKYTKLTANYPLIENVPSEELIWIPAKTLKESELVGRRIKRTIDYLMRNVKKKQPDGTWTGMYDKAAVMELVENGTNSVSESDMETTRNNHTDDDTYDIDDPNREVTVIECFATADINGDKMLEDLIIAVVEDTNTFIRFEENQDGFPFCIVSPVFDPYKIVPDISGIDALGQWQDLLTAIIRLTVQNLALNNNPQQLCNTSAFVDFNQVLDGDQFIEVSLPPAECMQPTAEIPLAPYTLQLIEMVKGWGEEASNINRYNQGIDANSLNKTATGITALINQGSQAMELIMRNIAETGLKDLFMRMVYLNQKYIDHDQVIRLTNKDITVNKDNLRGDFDFIVNAGMGAGAKETDIANITQVIQEMPVLMQAGLATIKNAYNAYKKRLELIGIRNVDDYISDPEQQQQAQPQQDNLEEKLSVAFKDLPIAAKVQVLQRMGIQVTPQDFLLDMQLEAQAEAVKTKVQSEARQQEAMLQHQHGMQAAQANNEAKERQAVLNGHIQNTRIANQGGGGQGSQGVPGGGVQGIPGGDMANGLPIPGQGPGGPLPTEGNNFY